MLWLRIFSGSSGGACRSTISIAGEMPAIAALAVARSAPAATSRPIWTATSGSATGFAERPVAGVEALAPRRELRRHAAHDARIIPEIHVTAPCRATDP